MHEWDCVLNCNNTLIFFKALLISENAKLLYKPKYWRTSKQGLIKRGVNCGQVTCF